MLTTQSLYKASQNKQVHFVDQKHHASVEVTVARLENSQEEIRVPKDRPEEP